VEEPVILRVVRGRIRPGERDAVLSSVHADYEPILERTPGLLRFVLGLRAAEDGGDRLAALSIWDGLDSASAAYGDLTVPRTIDGKDRGASYETVAYYELEALRISPPQAPRPRLLRVTAGTVRRGLDADIQQTLRERLAELPDEAVEAYVGRRVMGRAVEIAFLSTWSAEPPGRSLAEPIWPDISDRYETFALEVHEVAMIGDGPARPSLG
jgi:hypothetical protein